MDLVLAGIVPLVLGIVLEPKWAIAAAVGVVLAVILLWKFMKLAFRIALVVAAAVALYFLLKWGNVI